MKYNLTIFAGFASILGIFLVFEGEQIFFQELAPGCVLKRIPLYTNFGDRARAYFSGVHHVDT